MNWIINIIASTLICYAIYLQVWNLVKYRDTNGVLFVRLIMLGIAVSIAAHIVRMMVNGCDESMFFLLVTSVLFVIQYHGFRRLFNK